MLNKKIVPLALTIYKLFSKKINTDDNKDLSTTNFTVIKKMNCGFFFTDKQKGNRKKIMMDIRIIAYI
jgi:hypothetical protein